MKRRSVGILLVLLAVWPLVQHVLVRTLGVDPWRLFGFAMYSVPGSMKTVRVVEVSRAGRHTALKTSQYSPEEQHAVDVFRIRRQGLGRLASGDDLAVTMLARHPDWEGVALPVLSLELDPKTAFTRIEIEHATWWRDGRRDVYEVPIEAFVGSP